MQIDRTSQAYPIYTLPWAEVGPYLDKCLAAPKGQYSGTNDIAGLSWYGGMTYKQAVEATVEYKGAPAIPHIEIPGMHVRIDDVDYTYQVTGEVLDVASYTMGVPEHWLMPEPIQFEGSKTFKMLVEIDGAGSVEASELANRGQAIVALIHSLELQGYSVGIDIVDAGKRGGKLTYALLIPLKAEGEPLNVNRAQFVIGHPAFYRRILFSLDHIVCSEPVEGLAPGTDSVTLPGYDLRLKYTDGLSSDPKESMAWVKRTLAKVSTNHKTESFDVELD